MIAAVVLAAGRSTRAGARNKLLASIGGEPMITRVVRRVIEGGAAPVVVVTGHEAEKVRAALAGITVTFAHNPDYAEGIATSIRAGIAALPGDVDGALVCLGDMPALESGDVAGLIAAFDPAAGAAICVPRAGGRQGNPVLFARTFFPELRALAGDRGAKALIAAHAEAVREVAVSGDGPLVDLDTEEDIAAFNRRPGDDPG
ncbi:MAG TPA: nucleotidyltransferase family protein [Alphaproteobacteria bacterium]